MAKYLEVPTKPKAVLAVQFTGVEAGTPTFNEHVPSWLLANMVRGRLSMVSSTLAFENVSVPVGAWLFVDDGDVTGDTLRFAPAIQFFVTFRPARKKQGPRTRNKTTTAHSLAAE